MEISIANEEEGLVRHKSVVKEPPQDDAFCQAFKALVCIVTFVLFGLLLTAIPRSCNSDSSAPSSIGKAPPLLNCSVSAYLGLQNRVSRFAATSLNKTTSFMVAGAKTCFVAQGGFVTDGLGHQLHGRLSWIVAQELFKEKLVYVHLPLAMLEHSKLSVNMVEQFFNMRSLFPNRSQVENELGKEMRIRNDWEERFAFLDAVKTNGCDAAELWILDNAWETIWSNQYIRDVETIIQRSPIFHKLRSAYWSSPKPPLGFMENRPNVVIHIRRGDASDRLPNAGQYYLEAAQYYQDYFEAVSSLAKPYFTVETDDKSWPQLFELKKKVGGDHFRVGNDDEMDVLSAFHRMVAADGFVAAYSSLSNAAVFYRKFDVPIVAPAVTKRNYINYFPMSVYELI
jgi:hypothetical protein